jgi:5-methyltetrahydropteroyltriglutamate--homocysteine methyltransferase
MHTPFRYDYVGSFLRPTRIKEARIKYENKEISFEELTKIEDEEITKLVKKQIELGYHVITDGEFRRQAWHLDFMWGFKGIGHSKTNHGLPFHDENAMIDDTYLVSKLSYEGNHPFIRHFKFLKQFEDENHVAKLTIPSPAQFLEQLIMPFARDNTMKYYQNDQEVIADLVSCYKGFIKDIYDAGCRNLQFDDCSWGLLLDASALRVFNTDILGLERIKQQFVDVNNEVINSKPKDLIINTHICRGNFHSTYASSGPYDKVAPYVFNKENVNAFYLEYDDSRSGGFEALEFVPKDKYVVLGLITTKSPKLEDEEAIIARIKEASKYHPLEYLCLSPQCGFASCEIGNKLTEEEQWNKLKLVKSIAEKVW